MRYKEFDKEFETSYTEFPICPHCSYSHHDAWEWTRDTGEAECEECGKEFIWERHVDVSYCTSTPLSEEQSK